MKNLGVSIPVLPKIYFASDHDLDQTMIDPDAVYVLDKLRQAGFIAYLVGGSVRDLLVKRSPKDCDISTSARPEQIKHLFQRQCILIGRRFRLAHVRFGHKIIEVSTFRTGENQDELIVHDNQWGTPEQDVLRRDFTINGLFYDPSNHSVIDYVGGWDDIHHGIIRSIGNPEMRFKQDPVRMLRLLKFKARFNFTVDPETEQATRQWREEILKSSPARILEEMLRMLESGAAAPFFRLMLDYGMLDLLFPELARFLKGPQGSKIFRYLASADQVHRHQGKNTLNRDVLAACLLFPILEEEIKKQYVDENSMPHLGELTILTSTIIKDILLSAFPHFPRRLSAGIASAMVAQYRLTPLTGRRHARSKFLHHKEFEAALQFLKLRAIIDERLVDTYTALRSQFRQLRH
jgi:poly(A) polymerase